VWYFRNEVSAGFFICIVSLFSVRPVSSHLSVTSADLPEYHYGRSETPTVTGFAISVDASKATRCELRVDRAAPNLSRRKQPGTIAHSMNSAEAAAKVVEPIKFLRCSSFAMSQAKIGQISSQPVQLPDHKRDRRPFSASLLSRSLSQKK
jgi:hypothetical protein